MQYNLSVCICTRNRPEELKKALNSLECSSYPVYEVIVSDDSTNQETQTLIAAHFPKAKYLPGPRRGLGANRNNALKAVTGSHVLFIDDDVVLGEQFLEKTFEQLEFCLSQENQDISKIIVTGIENQNGELVFPHEQDFLGFQKVDYGQDDFIKTVVINSAVFPSLLFKEVLFDEKLVYGCDEVDFTTRAVQAGYKIVLCSSAVNFHFPSTINRDFYKPYHAASRLYVTFKRYFSTEKKRLKALAYLCIASVHEVTHILKVEGIQGILKPIHTFRTVASYVVRE
ncbi:MAG TPA: glycosyltransferase family 2 protein, partial [Cyanobacteria bacterium UBA8543]|nr:glycosyltransferase family 2 protein [Cyanobacteria bacterium UBA8543]